MTVVDDRLVNLIVRPDGTAELDDREPDKVVLATLGTRGVVAISLNVTGPDGEMQLVGKAHMLVGSEDDVNTVARLAVVELTSHHFLFNGPVVLTHLDAGTAHLLLEIARNA